jgi:hypothetical protein
MKNETLLVVSQCMIVVDRIYQEAHNDRYEGKQDAAEGIRGFTFLPKPLL